MYIERPVGYLSLVRSVHWEEVCRSAREQRFVSDNWLSMSEPLCSMSSMVSLWYVHITAGMASSAGQLYHVLFLPTHVPVILSHFDSFFEQVCPAVRPHLSGIDRGSRKGGPPRFGTKELPGARIATSLTLTPHVVTSSCCQGVWSRGVVKECCQQVLSRSVVSWFYM